MGAGSLKRVPTVRRVMSEDEGPGLGDLVDDILETPKSKRKSGLRQRGCYSESAEITAKSFKSTRWF